MSEPVLDARTQALVDAASRVGVSAEAFELDAKATGETLDISAYVIEAECSACGAEGVMVHPRWRLAARCATCIIDGRPHGPVLPDDREDVPHAPMPMRAWQDKTATRAPHPQPVVRATEDLPEGVSVPRAVLSLQKSAESFGWSVRVLYTKGTKQHKTNGSALSVAESFAVKAVKDGHRVVAVYSGTWDSMWSVRHMLQLRTVEQLSLLLAGQLDIEATRAANRALVVQKSAEAKCSSGDIHEPHQWINRKKAAKWCTGRKTVKKTTTKEDGG